MVTGPSEQPSQALPSQSTSAMSTPSPSTSSSSSSISGIATETLQTPNWTNRGWDVKSHFTTASQSSSATNVRSFSILQIFRKTTNTSPLSPQEKSKNSETANQLIKTISSSTESSITKFNALIKLNDYINENKDLFVLVKTESVKRSMQKILDKELLSSAAAVVMLNLIAPANPDFIKATLNEMVIDNSNPLQAAETLEQLILFIDRLENKETYLAALKNSLPDNFLNEMISILSANQNIDKTIKLLELLKPIASDSELEIIIENLTMLQQVKALIQLAETLSRIDSTPIYQEALDYPDNQKPTSLLQGLMKNVDELDTRNDFNRNPIRINNQLCVNTEEKNDALRKINSNATILDPLQKAIILRLNQGGSAYSLKRIPELMTHDLSPQFLPGGNELPKEVFVQDGKVITIHHMLVRRENWNYIEDQGDPPKRKLDGYELHSSVIVTDLNNNLINEQVVTHAEFNAKTFPPSLTTPNDEGNYLSDQVVKEVLGERIRDPAYRAKVFDPIINGKK